MRPQREGRILIAIVAAHLVAAAALTPGYLEPDSVATFAWLRSIVFNGDLLFFDEWRGFGLIEGGIPYFKEVTAIGALANHWWVGASILSAPAYLLAHLLSAKGGANGFGGLYGHALAWTAVAFGALASILAWRLLRGLEIARAHALGAIAAVWLGSPMFWYEYRHPLGTHLAGVLCVAVLVAVLSRIETDPDRRLDLLLGLWLGLAIATRIQHLFLAPAIALHLWRVRRPFRSWLMVAAGAALPAAAQALAWTAVYGQPLGPLAAGSSPLGGTWMPFSSIALDEVILSTWHGIIPWAPVLALAVIGWIVNVRTRVLAGTLLAMFAGEWAANGLLDRYFWGGLSFGPRRFVDLAVPFMVGLAWFLRRTRTAGALAAAAATLWTVMLAVAAAAGTLDLAAYVTGRDMVSALGRVRWADAGGLLVRGSALARAPLATLAGFGVAALVGAAGYALAFRRRAALLGTLALAGAGVIAAALAIAPTHRRAPEALRQFAIVMPAAREAGPLIDARGLLFQEWRFLERQGRATEARATGRLIEEIDRRLAAMGVAP